MIRLACAPVQPRQLAEERVASELADALAADEHIDAVLDITLKSIDASDCSATARPRLNIDSRDGGNPPEAVAGC